MLFIVLCEQCGLVVTCTTDHTARKNAGDHYDEAHAGTREVSVYKAQLVDQLLGAFSAQK